MVSSRKWNASNDFFNNSVSTFTNKYQYINQPNQKKSSKATNTNLDEKDINSKSNSKNNQKCIAFRIRKENKNLSAKDGGSIRKKCHKIITTGSNYSKLEYDASKVQNNDRIVPCRKTENNHGKVLKNCHKQHYADPSCRSNSTILSDKAFDGMRIMNVNLNYDGNSMSTKEISNGSFDKYRYDKDVNQIEANKTSKEKHLSKECWKGKMRNILNDNKTTLAINICRNEDYRSNSGYRSMVASNDTPSKIVAISMLALGCAVLSMFYWKGKSSILGISKQIQRMGLRVENNVMYYIAKVIAEAINALILGIFELMKRSLTI